MLQVFDYWIIGILCFSEMHVIAALQRRFVSILFRHGDRAPVDYTLGYQYPNGVGELTNAGMLREYELGQHIREEYGEFLGEIYYPRIAIARSTDVDRTKMSLQLVMAGIFPPRKLQQWNQHIHWQPVIADYVPGAHDFLLTPQSCPKFMEELKAVKESLALQREISKFNDLMKNLTESIGQPITSLHELADLYDDLASINSMGLRLPKWTRQIFPDGALLDAATLYLELQSYNQKLIKLNGGMILRNFTDTMSAIINSHGKSDTKILLLSAHDTNIIALLISLGVHKLFAPQYSAAIFFELLEHNYQYYIRIFYYSGIPAERVPIAIPHCGNVCSFDNFMKLYRNVLPTDQEICSMKN